MQVNKIYSISFKNKENLPDKIWEPRTYYIGNTTVTLTAEEEKLYRTAIKESWKRTGLGTLAGFGAGIVGASIAGRKRLTIPAMLLVGAITGYAGSICGALSSVFTGEAQYTRLPYNKLVMERGYARHNLANMNIDDSKKVNS